VLGALTSLGYVVASARRRSSIPDRRLAVCLALGGTAVVVGGGVGALLGVLTFMLVIDALVPIPGVTRTEADARFARLVRERRHAERMRRLRRLPAERLDVLDDRVGWASVAERRALGVQPISIGSVTGTVEELKARTFDRGFRPVPSSREHWKRLWLAQADGSTLPPVSVYRVGDQHVLRDGHHRVSVARDRGLETIEAEVVELRRAG
jgi:hypothetical protein